MDISKIAVIVLIAIAFAFLVYFEMNSRRNARKQQQTAALQDQPPKPTDR